MDLKNIIAAIALSAAVIVLYGLFFAPTQKNINESELNRNNEILSDNSDVPTVEEKFEIKSISWDRRAKAVSCKRRDCSRIRFWRRRTC